MYDAYTLKEDPCCALIKCVVKLIQQLFKAAYVVFHCSKTSALNYVSVISHKFICFLKSENFTLLIRRPRLDLFKYVPIKNTQVI